MVEVIQAPAAKSRYGAESIYARAPDLCAVCSPPATLLTGGSQKCTKKSHTEKAASADSMAAYLRGEDLYGAGTLRQPLRPEGRGTSTAFVAATALAQPLQLSHSPQLL